MILYLDTSSLVKLYIEEAHSSAVAEWAGEAEVIATSRVAYPEAMSAVARRHRARDLTREGFDAVRAALADQWKQIAVIDMDEVAAGNLAVRHALRGFDAIHLEAALAAQAKAATVAVCFSSFDVQLNAAAEAEGLTILTP